MPGQPAAPHDPHEVAYTVHIEPAGLLFTTRSDQALLVAALAAGIDLPRSCRNGTCRACLCRLQAGQISYRIEWPGLSADEKAEGWILPCVAQACSDLVLHAPAARLLSRG